MKLHELERLLRQIKYKVIMNGHFNSKMKVKNREQKFVAFLWLLVAPYLLQEASTESDDEN